MKDICLEAWLNMSPKKLLLEYEQALKDIRAKQQKLIKRSKPPKIVDYIISMDDDFRLILKFMHATLIMLVEQETQKEKGGRDWRTDHDVEP